MMFFFYLLLVIIFIKVILNFNNYHQIKKFYDKYRNYIKDNNWKFIEYQKKIVQLFEDAGIEDSSVPVVEPVGYSHVTAANVRFYKNLNNTREDIVSLSQKAFHQAIGVYRQRMIDAINPLYWIKFILYLPKIALGYLGVKENNFFINLFQIVYWLCSIIVGILSLDNIEIIKKFNLWLNSLI